MCKETKPIEKNVCTESHLFYLIFDEDISWIISFWVGFNNIFVQYPLFDRQKSFFNRLTAQKNKVSTILRQWKSEILFIFKPFFLFNNKFCILEVNE